MDTNFLIENTEIYHDSFRNKNLNNNVLMPERQRTLIAASIIITEFTNAHYWSQWDYRSYKNHVFHGEVGCVHGFL